MAGQHRKPPKYTPAQLAGRAATTGVATVGGLGVLTSVAPDAFADAPPDALAVIAHCESGGNPKAENPTSTASGLYQIVDGTWRGAGGVELTGVTHAAFASAADQTIIANRIYTRAGNTFRDWDASKNCWGGKIGNTAPVATMITPPPASPVPQPAASPPGAATYRVALGDTLVKIAAKTNTKWRDLAALNGLSAPYTIYPGNVIKLSGTPVSAAASVTGGTSYTVQRGDTLQTIAARHATTWQTLFSINRGVIKDPHWIFPGEVIKLPGDGTVVINVSPPPPPPASAPALAPAAAVAPAASSVGQAALNAALGKVGAPYAWGAAGPSSFDCSGLVIWAYAQAGHPGLPHFSGDLARVGTAVSLANAQPGDIVAWPGHVGLYAGGGKIMAATTEGHAAAVQPLSWFPAPSTIRRVS